MIVVSTLCTAKVVFTLSLPGGPERACPRGRRRRAREGNPGLRS